MGKESLGGGYYLYLVTNRHVIQDKKDILIRFKRKNTECLIEQIIPLCNFDDAFFTTSNNKLIDIAVISIDGSLISDDVENFGFFDIDANSYTSNEYLFEGGNIGSPVFMLGYPMGLVEDYSNLPICRVGCMARIDKIELRNNYRFLLDIMNYPGNSGSPILSAPDNCSINNTKAINKCQLIGIVHSYIPYEEQLLNIQSKKVVEIRSENSGIAIANPVECIKELINKDLFTRGIYNYKGSLFDLKYIDEDYGIHGSISEEELNDILKSEY